MHTSGRILHGERCKPSVSTAHHQSIDEMRQRRPGMILSPSIFHKANAPRSLVLRSCFSVRVCLEPMKASHGYSIDFHDKHRTFALTWLYSVGVVVTCWTGVGIRQATSAPSALDTFDTGGGGYSPVSSLPAVPKVCLIHVIYCYRKKGWQDWKPN